MRTRKGTRPQNILPLRAGGSDTGWIDLTAAPVQRQSSGKIYVSVADKKQRMIHSALKRLSNPQVELVSLPHGNKRVGRYEGFRLLNEGGSRQNAEAVEYSVPTDDEATFSLPVGLFKNGWIHLLEDVEIAFILMLASQQAIEGHNESIKIYSATRIEHYGIGRDAYSSHETLKLLGLLEVKTEADRRGLDFHDFWWGKERLHKLRLMDEGFEESAIEIFKRMMPLSIF
jgi:hypothetical protein